MARKSSITRLPAEIKSYIEAMLATGAQTLDELIADLQQRFPAEASAGQLPSRSAVHRYGAKLDRRLAAIKASTEAARLISEQAGDSKDARSEALTALVQTELFEAILSLQEADDPDVDTAESVGLFFDGLLDHARLQQLLEQQVAVRQLGTCGGELLAAEVGAGHPRQLVGDGLVGAVLVRHVAQ